jgi:uncharacterized protein
VVAGSTPCIDRPFRALITVTPSPTFRPVPQPQEDRSLHLQTRDGVVLSAAMVVPEQPAGSVVVCHPHPLFGGTMESKVVTTTHRAFRDQGFASIRFDFRGAGGSEGSHDRGRAERLDVLAAADAVEAELPDDAGLPRVLGGYSFGSLVGLRAAAADLRFSHRIGIAPPLAVDLPDEREYDFSFLLVDDPRPLFLLAGSLDEFCPELMFRDLVTRLRYAGVPVQATLLPAATHFFDGHAHVLRQEMGRIAAAILAAPVPDRRHPAIDL